MSDFPALFTPPVHTPLVPVALDEGQVPIWCKLEFLNPSGSTKDRVASYILEHAWRNDEVGPGSLVVEASSGSTSIALALICAQLGLRFVAVMPEGVSRERTLIIRAYGGDVVLTSAADGIRGALATAERLARERRAFATRQFENPNNADAHRLGTAREIVAAIPGSRVDGIVSGVGTGGTIVGLHDGVRDHDEDVALETARRLIRRGLPVGPSSGLNYAAARVAQQRLGAEAAVVTVFPDRMERYFSTALFAGVS